MKHIERSVDDWPLGNILWFAVVIWFSSSLLSQSAYMAVNGLPYDAVAMLETLGPLYYLVMLVELVIWGGLLAMGWKKMARSRRNKVSASTA